MGISGLLPLLKSIHRPCKLKKFAGQTIGVDAYGWLHRGTVACAIELALDKPTTKYVDFAMSRVRMLIHFGITPYLVFDGDYLPGKAGTEKDRANRRKESKRVGLELLNLGRTSQAHLELQKAVDVTPEMARMLIEELKRQNIQYVVAPYEADSQLAYLECKGIINGILSEDSDLLVFGAKCLITKLDQYGDCVMINRNEFSAVREVSLTGWTDSDFRRMAILSGCDYLPSIDKMGLKTAYRLLRKHKSLDRLIRALQFDGKYKVPSGYLEAFNQAEMTFLYQWVFCPVTNELVNLKEPEPGIEPKELSYIGSYVESDVALGVANGNLHPHTKEPIIVAIRQRGPPPSQRPSSMVRNVTQTPDLKNSRPIDTFFKPKRTPLAELDPNIFTPSPSQQRLMDERQNSWSANPVHVQTQPNRRPSSLASTAPQPARRAVSDSFARPVPAPHPPKRQRLCTDPKASPPTDESFRLETGRSKFFAPSIADPSPSVRPGKKARKEAKSEFNLWSDDSIEDAMLELPDLDDAPVKPKKKIPIFTDDASPVNFRESQSSTISTVFTEQCDQTIGSLTPATSFSGSPAPPVDEEPGFSKHLSAQIQALRSEFSFRPDNSPSRASPLATVRSRSSPKKALARTSSAPASSAVLQSMAKRQKLLEEASGNDNHKSADSSTARLPPAVKSATQVDEETSAQVEIEDSAWAAMEAKTIIPPSVDESAKDIVPSKGADMEAKGSEDLIVPDSEGDSDGSPGPKPVLNLKRFAFSA